MQKDTLDFIRLKERNMTLETTLATAAEESTKSWNKRPPPSSSQDESKPTCHHRQHHQHHPHGARRKGKRRYRRNQDAINFLRRFTLGVVVIDLMLAISESSLVSTFFLFLTLSTTFDVKPENVIETYCYYAPVGTNLCDDYMDRLTGYTSSPSSSPPLNHYSKGGGGVTLPSTSSPVVNSSQSHALPIPPPTETHYPTIPTRTRLSEEESYQLFLIYNQSFYDPPARFNLEWKLDRNSRLSKLYSQLVLDLAKNQVVVHNRSSLVTSTIFNISIPLPSDSRNFNSFRQAVEVSPPSAPSLRNEIPQVLTAIRRTSAMEKIRKKLLDNAGGEFLPSAPSKLWDDSRYFILDDYKTPSFKNMHRNLVQIRDFIRHRWKRNARTRPTSVPNTTSPSFGNGNGEMSAIERPQTGAPSPTASGTGMPSPISKEKATVQQQQSKHEPSSISNPGKASSSNGDGGNDSQVNKRSGMIMSGNGEGERLETPLIKGNKTAGHNQPHEYDTHNNKPGMTMTISPEIQSSSVTTQQHPKGKPAGERKVKEADALLMREMYKVMSQRERSGKFPKAAELSSNNNMRNNLELIIATAEANLNAFTSANSKSNAHKANSPHPSPGRSQLKRKNQKWKEFQELLAKLERSPRSLLGLMEASLFNNWRRFLEQARRRVTYANADCSPWDSQCAGMTIPLSRPDEGRLQQLDNLLLNMEMDIFSAETYQKAERRKRAIQQVYHDYSSTILGDLEGLKEIPVSRTFYSIYTTVKFYTFVWQVVICLVLFFGSVYEDKTALNIWGIFNILTSLLHFLVDEWINTSFQPEKTSAAIWFGVVYGVYKPITILLVATLSSEILKSSSNGRKQKGLWGNLREIIKGRKRPPLSNTLKYLEKLGEVIVVKDGGSGGGGEKTGAGNNDDNENNNSSEITMKVNLVEFQNDKAVVSPCPTEKFRAEILSKSPCYLFTANESEGGLMSLTENGSSNFRAVRIDTKNVERLSESQLAHLLEELKLLSSCLHSERPLAYDTLAEELTETESEEDEDQVEVVEEDDDETDSDMGEELDLEETATTIENSHFSYHNEPGGQQNREMGLPSLSNQQGMGSPQVTMLSERRQNGEIMMGGCLATISGDPGNSLNMSACDHLSQELQGTNPLIVDGGNVHI